MKQSFAAAAELQQELVYTAAVNAHSKETAAAKAFMDYLKDACRRGDHQSQGHESRLRLAISPR